MSLGLGEHPFLKLPIFFQQSWLEVTRESSHAAIHDEALSYVVKRDSYDLKPEIASLKVSPKFSDAEPTCLEILLFP